jgi:hypothetical protein
MIMGRDQRLSPRIRPAAAERRAASRPLTQRQERLLLYVVFTIGAALQLAAILKVLPFIS